MNALKPKKAERSPPTVDEVVAEIDAKKAEIKRNERRQFDLVEKTTYDDAADAEYEKLTAASAVLENDIARLQAVAAKLQQQNRTAAVAGYASVRRGQLAEFEVHANRSLEEVAKLAAGLEAASKAYAEFFIAAEQMKACLPAGIDLSPSEAAALDYSVGGGGVISMNLAIAVAAEMFRVAASPRLRLPGAKAPTLQLVDAPGAIDPMVTARQRVTEFMIGQVRAAVARAEAAETEDLAS